MPQPQITASAHGKINWTLDVFGRRPDGLHEIASIMQRIALADQMTFSSCSSGIHLTVDGPEATGVPADETNIAWKAASLLCVDGVHIHVTKFLPSQAGLGGGSSDGATALIALNQLFNLQLSGFKLREAAAKLGADVSFFLSNGPARIGGFGEIVTPVSPIISVDLVIVKPNVGVSTVSAYGALDRISGRLSANASQLWPNVSPSNDFESAIFALYPEVADVSRALRDAGAEGSLLCGSGAAVMGWGENTPLIAERLKSAGYTKIWLTRTIN